MGLILGSGSTKPTYPYDQWYGVELDLGSTDHKLTRIGNSDLHKSLPVQNLLKRFIENEDGSVKTYLHQNDSRKTSGGATATIDSTAGNVMLEKPEYYLRVELDGTKYRYAISMLPLPGFIKMERKTVSPWYGSIDLTNNKAVSGCWLTWNGDVPARDSNGYVVLKSNAAQFRGGAGTSDSDKDGKYNSQLGMPRTSVSKATVRNVCKNGTHIGAYRVMNEIAWLFRIEYATRNCQLDYNSTLDGNGYHQGGLGSGCTVADAEWKTWGAYKPFVPCGVTAPLGNNTGKVNFVVKGWTGGDKTISVTSYRGLEVPFEYLYCLADDLLCHHSPDTEDGKSQMYLCEDPTKFTSHSDSATTVPDGYKLMADLPRSSDYILQCEITEKGYTFPTSVGGSATTGWCDRYYMPGTDASGWYGVLLFGNANLGAAAGFGCTPTHIRSSDSNAYIGFRLCRN